MSHHDENFRDEAGILYAIPALAILVGMNCLPATIFWSRYFLG